MKQTQSRITQHKLLISDPDKTLQFYQDCLGMELFSTTSKSDEKRYYVGFRNNEGHCPTQLELIYNPTKSITKERGESESGYWKIGITLPDVDLARRFLLTADIAVSQPKQFRDIGYLCHLQDPDGYSIELLQQRFAQNHRPHTPQPEYKLGTRPTLGQITLRVKDADASLDFYRNRLGMTLLSRQIVEPYHFTLYFLAYTAEKPPHPDIDAIENREWLWQRPYTTLELQHRWDTEKDTSFKYDTTVSRGFVGLQIETPYIEDSNLLTREQPDSINAYLIYDPDLYPIYLTTK